MELVSVPPPDLADDAPNTPQSPLGTDTDIELPYTPYAPPVRPSGANRRNPPVTIEDWPDPEASPPEVDDLINDHDVAELDSLLASIGLESTDTSNEAALQLAE